MLGANLRKVNHEADIVVSYCSTTPQCDSSQMCTRAVRPGPSPADLPPLETAGVSAVSRFSCVKFLGVLWDP